MIHILLSIIVLQLNTGDIKSKTGQVPSVKISGYTHFIYTYHTADSIIDNFNITHARVKFYGNLSRRLFFRLEPNLLTGKIRYAYFDMSLFPFTSLRVGQFKVPFGAEYQPYPVKNLTPTLSKATQLFTREVITGDKGLELHGEFPHLKYALALMEADPTIENKAIGGMISIFPLRKLIEVGAAYYNGEYSQKVKFMNGFAKIDLGVVDLRSEIIKGYIGDTDKIGYTLTLYAPIRSQKLHGRSIIPVIKYGYADPDTHADGDASKEIHAGLLLKYHKHLKVFAFYEIYQEETNDIDNNRFIIDFNFSF